MFRVCLKKMGIAVLQNLIGIHDALSICFNLFNVTEVGDIKEQISIQIFLSDDGTNPI